MTDEPYTNLDLDTAEALLISAGRPELAQALRYQAQGVRNLVQGEWGGAFVRTLENVMDTRVVNVLASVQQRLDQQIELVQQILTAHKETVRGLKKVQGQMRESQEDRRAIHTEVAEVKADMELMKTVIAADIQSRLEVLEADRKEQEDERRRLEKIESLLSSLALRLGDALPTEEDQELSTKLRAERGDG